MTRPLRPDDWSDLDRWAGFAVLMLPLLLALAVVLAVALWTC